AGSGEAEGTVAPLPAAGGRAAALEARLLAAALLQRAARSDQAEAQLAAASRARGRRGPATLRARGWYAEALRRSHAGDPRGAVRATRAGVRLLETYQTALGATDLRARASGHRAALAGLGLRLALAEGSPRGVFEWAERGKASHLLLPPLRPPDDPELADLLAQLRTTVPEVNESARTTAPVAGRLARLGHRQVALERAVRDRARRRPGEPAARPAGPVRPAELTATLADCALVEYFPLDGTIQAISLVAGRVRVRPVAPADRVQDLLDRVPFALRRLIYRDRRDGHRAAESAAIKLLRHAADNLDRLLVRPPAELGDRPLLLVPTRALQSL